MFRSVFRYWRYALPAALLMVLEVLADLWQPRLMAEIVDQGILGLEGSGGASADIIRSTGLVMLAVTFGGCLCGVLSGACASIFSQCAAHGIRRECFSTVMKFSPREIQEFTAGSLLTRCTQDAAQIQMTLAQAVRGGVRCLMFLGAGSAALLAMSPDFALVMAIAVPLVILETVFVLRRASPLFTRTQESLDRLNTVIRESVEGIRIIKACAGEEREERKFTGASRDLSDLQFRTAVLLCTLHPVMNIVLNLAAAGIIQIGAFQVEAGALAPGAVIAGVTYASQILMSLLMAAMLFQSASRGAASAARISQVLRCQATSRGGNVTSGSRKGEVEFRNVTFSYPGRSATALEKASFTIGRGQFLAILGSTGSGKSTIARLLLGFHEPDEGQILVEGTDTREFDRTALRTCIAAVLQDCRIFRGTVAANIAAGGNEEDLEGIRRAAELAQADSFISALPEGYRTFLPGGGAGLSGGQRQRIAIARALYRHQDILLLDDSFSALDSETEARVREGIRKSCRGMTRIIITQRAATVRDADLILVLDRGQICAAGTHRELTASSPEYRAILSSQEEESHES